MKLPFNTGFDLFGAIHQTPLSLLSEAENMLRELEFLQEENKKGEKMLREIQDRMFRAKKKYRQFELLAVGELVGYKCRLEAVMETNEDVIKGMLSLLAQA